MKPVKMDAVIVLGLELGRYLHKKADGGVHLIPEQPEHTEGIPGRRGGVGVPGEKQGRVWTRTPRSCHGPNSQNNRISCDPTLPANGIDGSHHHPDHVH